MSRHKVFCHERDPLPLELQLRCCDGNAGALPAHAIRVLKFPHYHEPDVRVRWEPPEVIAALILALRLEWMRDAAIVAVATGMREGD